MITIGSWFIWFWQQKEPSQELGYSSDELSALQELQEDNNRLQAELIQLKEDLIKFEAKETQNDSGLVAGVKDQVSTEGNLININTATQEQLEDLPGIGPSKALAIIDFRDKKGGFSSTQQLLEVSGIGNKTFGQLKDLVTVN